MAGNGPISNSCSFDQREKTDSAPDTSVLEPIISYSLQICFIIVYPPARGDNP